MTGMSDWNWCGECRCLHVDGVHHPLWTVWCPDYNEERMDVSPVRAATAPLAAERWAEGDDSDGDYTIVGGSPATVLVARTGEEPTRWLVSGETVAEYSAREIDDD